MELYNLYLVLVDERIIYDNATNSIVYEGSSQNIPHELMNELVHVTIAHEKGTNRIFFHKY